MTVLPKLFGEGNETLSACRPCGSQDLFSVGSAAKTARSSGPPTYG